MNETNEIRKRLHEARGGNAYVLEVFGDHLAQQQGYKDEDQRGLEALRYYLMQKHHWLPREVRSLSQDDLEFALREELTGWTLPADAR